MLDKVLKLLHPGKVNVTVNQLFATTAGVIELPEKGKLSESLTLIIFHLSRTVLEERYGCLCTHTLALARAGGVSRKNQSKRERTKSRKWLLKTRM